MEQRISLITLGVEDVGRATVFYERLGWKPTLIVQDTAFFQVGPFAVVLWSRAKLAADCGVVAGGGWGGAALAHNVGAAADVDAVIDEARRAGATITRPPAPTFYGGYAGVFLDLDGHAWEVAHNPGMPLAADGSFVVPSTL